MSLDFDEALEQWGNEREKKPLVGLLNFFLSWRESEDDEEPEEWDE